MDRREAQDAGGPASVPEHMRIEDTEAWFRGNTIREAGASSPTLDQSEERNRFELQKEYQEKVHKVLFADAEAEEKRKEDDRMKQLELLKSGTIVLSTSQGDLDELPLFPFAESCDTIFALASSWANDESKKTKIVMCNLPDFSLVATEKFAHCVLGNAQVHELEADSVVECCCIADYLQNTKIRNGTEQILQNSIDTTNCLSLCQLADQLGMPSLFELSLQHMMRTLGSVEEGSDCWQELTPDLRERVLLIKGAIQSSVHSQRSKLYFNSLAEYVSIFAERVQYYKERLAEAKDQLEDLPPGSSLFEDTQMKIYKQEQRVKTLATALAEQKKLFGSKRMVPPALLRIDSTN